MEQLKEDSIAGTSDENPKEDGLSEGADQRSEVGRPQCVIKEEVINNEYDFPEKVPTSWKDANKEERTFMVTFTESGKKHLVGGRLTDSLLSALKSSTYVCDWMERNKTKEFHLIEKREPFNVCVNMGMPLKYVSDGSQFEMKSYKPTKNENTNELWYRQYDDRKEECTVFYVYGRGSRMESHGAQGRRLIKNQSLLKEYCIFCIFAPKGESIKDALCNDGRFRSLLQENNWTLVKDGKIIDNNFLVNSLSDQVYEIEVESKKSARYSGDRNKKLNDLDLGGQQLSTFEKPQTRPDFEEEQLSAAKQQPELDCEQVQLGTSKKQQLQDFEWQILQLYPKLMEERQNIDKFLRRCKKDPLEVCKRNFGKEVNDSFSFKLMKTLVKYGDSVGYIEWRDALGCVQGAATCFVLRGRYILTCHHVIKMIVGEGIEAKDWGDRIKQSARVTFSYVEQHPSENWFSLENWFEIADVDLDFAVLKLEENESKSHPPPGLLQLHFPSPPNGPIFIIGHPSGGIKSTDICLVVSVFDRSNEFSDHLHKRQNTEHSNSVCGYSQKKKCIHMYNPKDFEGYRSDPNVVTYNTCFFEGSSGSPVFNKNGELVALHAAGFAYKMGNKDCSIIEWGYSIHSIILKIKSNFKSWYDAIIGPDSSHVDALLNEAEEEMDCN